MMCTIKFQIVEQCEGCKHTDGFYCDAYPNPSYWHSNGRTCPLATHTKAEIKKTAAEKKRKGQQHQQKAAKVSRKQEKAYSRLKA